MANNTLNSTLSKLRYHNLITDEQYKTFKRSNIIQFEDDKKLLKDMFDECLKEWQYQRRLSN